VDELACFSEVSRERAFERFELLRVHLEDGIALAAIAREAKLSYRTLQHWLERYRTYGLVGLIHKPRTDRGRRRKLSAALQEVIEGLALQKPPLPIRVVCNRARLAAERLGEEPPSYDLVHDVVSHLPTDLVTLAHKGAKAYSNSFELVYRREAGQPNAIWQADHTPLDIELVQSELDPTRTASRGSPSSSTTTAGRLPDTLSHSNPHLQSTPPLLCGRQFGARRIPAGRFAGFRKSCTQITVVTLLPGIWSRSRRTSRSGSFSQHQVFRAAEGGSSGFFHRSIRCFCAHFRASNLQEAKNDSR